MLLAVSGTILLCRGKRPAEWPFALALLAGCIGVWLVYAISSRNLSGLGCSIRWFLPMIAPGYFVLAVLLRERPDLTRDSSARLLTTAQIEDAHSCSGLIARPLPSPA